jgi:hypothetical protein
MIDWENIFCPICGEKRKNTRKNKVWYDPKLSDKSKGKMVFYCTNHDPRIHFVLEVFEVKNDIVSVRAYVFQDRRIKK